jgi:hypothetical protein
MAILLVRLVCVSLVALAVLARPPAAEACTCGTPLCGGLGFADAVFVATVESITPPAPRLDGTMSSADLMAVTLKDVEVIRGEASRVVVTASGGASCGYSFEVGQRYLIVGSRRADGRIAVSHCSLTRRVADAAGLLDYARTLDGPASQTLVWGRIRMLSRWTDSTLEYEPIEGARVIVTGPVDRNLATDAEGRYRISDLPPGAYLARIEWPKGREYLKRATATRFTLVPEMLHPCSEIQTLAEIDSSVSGVVLDDAGRPLAKAFIYVGLAGQADPSARWAGGGTMTDADGRYRFDGLPPGSYSIGLDPWRPPDTATSVAPGQHVVVAPIRRRK